MQRFDDTCNCTLDDPVLKDSVLSCPAGESVATFNTTLVYSNTDGSLFASDIVNSTLNEFNSRINRTVNIDGVAYQVQNGPSDPEDSFELSEGAVIGIAFIGGFLAASVISVIVIIIM